MKATLINLFTLVAAASALAHGGGTCPSCGQRLAAAKAKRHMAFCCPDLLDPDGWAQGDRAVVLKHVRAKHKKSSSEARALNLRFGARVTVQSDLAEKMGWSLRKTRDTISQLLHSIPPVADSQGRLDVLYEDDSLIAVAKPAGVGVTPEHRLRGGSMLNRVLGHVLEQQSNNGVLTARARAQHPVPAPCHRLDQNTSGVLVFAKTAAAATGLMEQFEQRRVAKIYAALCADSPRVETIDAPICRVVGVTHCERKVCDPFEAAGQSATSSIAIVAQAPPFQRRDLPSPDDEAAAAAAAAAGLSHALASCTWRRSKGGPKGQALLRRCPISATCSTAAATTSRT